jgi:transcriptional regulator with XRE-family HTH domain
LTNRQNLKIIIEKSAKISAGAGTVVPNLAGFQYLGDMKANPRMIQKLLDLLKSRGYTQCAFESRMRWPKTRISKWANGKGEPTAMQAWLAAKELGVSVEYLFDDTMDNPTGTLPPEARTILEIAEHLGWEEAMNRLVGTSSVSRDELRGVAIPRGRPKRGDRAGGDVDPDRYDGLVAKGRTPRR